MLGAERRADVRGVVGRRGEDLALRWLVQHGAREVDRNWRCRDGELDLVVRDGDELVFVEVKTRTSTAFGHPAEAVTARKVARLRRLAAAWLAAHEVRADRVRIDVVAVLSEPGRPARLEHLRAVG
jgi:putative endonuclease